LQGKEVGVGKIDPKKYPISEWNKYYQKLFDTVSVKGKIVRFSRLPLMSFVTLEKMIKKRPTLYNLRLNTTSPPYWARAMNLCLIEKGDWIVWDGAVSHKEAEAIQMVFWKYKLKFAIVSEGLYISIEGLRTHCPDVWLRNLGCKTNEIVVLGRRRMKKAPKTSKTSKAPKKTVEPELDSKGRRRMKRSKIKSTKG
jgi:hypothetical protein